MSKKNFFLKYLKNIAKLINSLLEKNLNKLNLQNLIYLSKNNKIILTFVALFVIFLSYLLLPTFYNQSDISNKLQTELRNKLDLNFEFSNNIKYNFFPKPHFVIKNSTIFFDQKEISKIDKLKIFISFDNFFSFKKTQIKDLIIENANFNISKNNYNFFIKLLNKNFKYGKLLIKDSNIFFKNSFEEVLFINKIFKIKYYYNIKETKNIFYSDSEIFNVPFSIKTFFNEDKSKINSQINLDLLKLRIENELTLNNKKKIGKSEFYLKKIKRFVEYKIEENIFNFHIFDKIEDPNTTYKGQFNLKPFYGNIEGDLNEINLNHLFGSNPLIVELLKQKYLIAKILTLN